MNTAIIELPFGRLSISSADKVLLGLAFQPPDAALRAVSDEFQAKVAAQLHAWCADTGYVFDLPHQAQGSAHQDRVWAAISAIPCGETRSYGELAAMLQSSPRAVGNACGRNPLPILVPCHRVVAKQGLGGFNQSRDTWLLDIKRWLLNHEQRRTA